MQKLVLGYGNVDRQDDGVAWHTISQMISLLGFPPPAPFEELSPVTYGEVNFLFQLQLTPEMGELISGYDAVCFLDAHTGAVPDEIHFEEIHPDFQRSPFTHHLSPSTLLAISDSIYSKYPRSVLISVRGYEFGFSNTLSERSRALVKPAADMILKWFSLL